VQCTIASVIIDAVIVVISLIISRANTRRHKAAATDGLLHCCCYHADAPHDEFGTTSRHFFLTACESYTEL